MRLRQDDVAAARSRQAKLMILKRLMVVLSQTTTSSGPAPTMWAISAPSSRGFSTQPSLVQARRLWSRQHAVKRWRIRSGTSAGIRTHGVGVEMQAARCRARKSLGEAGEWVGSIEGEAGFQRGHGSVGQSHPIHCDKQIAYCIFERFLQE